MPTPTTDQLILQRRRNKHLAAQLELIKANGLAYYVPHSKQEQFHSNGDKTYRMVRAGNRFGKSQMGAAEDCAWLMGERTWLPKSDPNRTKGIPKHFVKIVVVCETWTKVEEIFTGPEGKIWQLLPTHAILEKSKNSQGVVSLIRTEHGLMRFVTIQGFKKEPMSMESSDYDAAHFDEPCPEAMYKAIHRGLVDRMGKCWFTLTPLKEMWINDKFFPHASTKKTIDSNHHAIEGFMTDNPHLTPEAIEMYKKELTEAEIQCRIFGKPLSLSGLVYKEFDYGRHVLKAVPHGWENHFTPPKNYTISYAIDTHDETPQAVLLMATSPFGQQFIYDEIWLRCTVDVLAEEIKRRVEGHQMHLRICDPRAWINDPIAGTSLAEALFEEGVYADKASKALSFGILQVRKALIKQNFIYVNPHLQQFHFEINRYVYDKENKPLDKDDHMMENLYRLLLRPPVWIDPEEQYDSEVARKPLYYNRSPVRGRVS